MNQLKIQFLTNLISKISLLFFVLFQLLACNNNFDSSINTDDWSFVALPDISKQPVKLRVANVVNPRFSQLTESQIQQILKRSQQLVKQHFNIEIEFISVETLSIGNVFRRLDSVVLAERKKEIVDLTLMDAPMRENMQQSLFKTLSNYSGNKQNVIDFAQPYLLQPEVKQKDFIGLSYALVDTLISRLSYWMTQVADDGKPVLNSDAYHEWVWWDSLGYSDLTYDVMITNQLVASAEYYAMDVHSSIRGGLTAGTTTYNKNTQFNTYVYIMVYPMLNDTDLLTMLRKDESYSDDQIINYSAALLTHELGHMLLHLGHPFGNKHCIMSPTVMLSYKDWYDHLDADKCAIGSNKDMMQGAAKIEYNRNW